MSKLNPMPTVEVSETELKVFGKKWIENGGNLSRTPPQSSSQLGSLLDSAVGKSLAVMLGNLAIVKPNMNALIPSKPDCVEVGPVRIVGGVRPQNFDVGYRPDGPRFAYDSKTLNDSKSLGKNFLNMINDLATEATTVHSRFPHAIVAFMFVVPKPCLDDQPRRSSAALQTLDRLAQRYNVKDPDHLAEAIAVIAWDPKTGKIDPNTPAIDSQLRIENFSKRIEEIYTSRYKGLPPHVVDESSSESTE